MQYTRREFLRYAAAAAVPFATGMRLDASSPAPDLNRGQAVAIIPSTGEKLPRIGLGTYQIFDQLEPQHAAALLGRFFALGGRLVDSSPMYGPAEEVTGTASVAANINDKLFLATKVWISGRERGVQQMQESLAKLRRQRLELMQIHNLVDWRTQLKTLRDYKERGIFKYIGLTHYSKSAFGELKKIIETERIDFLQIPYSIAETTAAMGKGSLVETAARRQVAVIANEPFAQGRLFSSVRGRAVPPWAIEQGMTSWAQFFLKFILGDERVQFVIPATNKLQHLQDNMAAGVGDYPVASVRARMQKEFLATR
jgi:diketogulonate reductase-like aldo/keto reductase